MKINNTELLNELDLFCEDKNIESSMDVYFAMLLIGSEKISVRSAAKALEISETELTNALNKFNIHHASI